MPIIVTTIHDPGALAATCRRLDLEPPTFNNLQFDRKEVSGWIVRLPGLPSPIVCDTLTGVLTYHPEGNTFHRYGRIMAFIHRYYDVRARLRQAHRRCR